MTAQELYEILSNVDPDIEIIVNNVGNDRSTAKDIHHVQIEDDKITLILK